MKIVSADLLAQAFVPDQIPRFRFPEVAVFGRSNVGKSSLLGALMGRARLARVSGTPGKTQGLFFYLVNDRMVLVDLPGYGFSKAPRRVKTGWKALVEAYLDREGAPRLALQLLDIRHIPTGDDLTVRRILAERGIPTLAVATKSDKLSRGPALRARQDIARALSIPPEEVVLFSIRKGKDPARALWSSIFRRLHLN